MKRLLKLWAVVNIFILITMFSVSFENAEITASIFIVSVGLNMIIAAMYVIWDVFFKTNHSNL